MSASPTAPASSGPEPAQQLPIAVIGTGCRLPGADDVPAFWEVLLAGRDTVGEIPPERFPVGRWHDPSDSAAGPIVSPAGGFLQGIDQFDAAFFSISPHEATRLDPQHRLLLEVTWDALEDAGIPAERLAGTNTSVYTGCLSSDYWDLLRAAQEFDLHAAMGSGSWGMPAGRISYHLDLRGPSMGVEAACATSLLGVHLACDALRTGQSDLAIVSNVNLLLSPDFYLGLSEAQILSPNGRSRFGDAAADGYVRSEGVVSLILKPLPQAIADGDRVYATILGSAVSNNGSSAGTLIASGQQGQEAALRSAYRMSGVSPAEIDYVEAHGPGTPLGDATELTALKEVLGAGRPADRPCLIGSAKSNLGHTEVAAGAVGLLKAVLALKHRTIPATLHVDQPRPELQGPVMPLRLALDTEPWPQSDRPALAGVSSFGLSGVNTHLVLQEAPEPAPVVRQHSGPNYLLPLSARDPLALHELATLYAEKLATEQDLDLLDVTYSAGSRRSQHPYRLAVVGSNPAELSKSLQAFGAGERRDGTVGGDLRAASTPRVVFVFSGHGSQWVGMGRSLLKTNGSFARTLHECSRAITHQLGWSLVERLRSDAPLTAADEVQPALWAMQVSLAALWREWGIEPDLVIGHSMGEVAAAVVSGALSVSDGAAVICRRSRLIRDQAEPGAMWAVQLGEAEARTAIGEAIDRVSIAVVNSAHSCVLSGEVEALAEIAEELSQRGVYCRRVQVDYASHSPQVDQVAEPLLAALSRLTPRAGTVPMHSTVQNAVIDGTQLDAGYWLANLRRPVRFGEAVQSILADTDRQPTLFIELNAHPSLLSAVEDGASAMRVDAPAIPSLLRGRPELESLLTSLGHAYVLGCTPNWEALNRGGRYVPLPAYPWQRRRYWVSPPVGAKSSYGPGTVVPSPTITDLDDIPPRPAKSQAPTAAPAATPSSSQSPASSSSPGLSLGRRAIGSAAAMTEHLVDRVAEALGMSPREVDLSLPLTMVGLDSLLAARIGEQLRHDLGVAVPVRELLGTPALAELAATLFTRTREA